MVKLNSYLILAIITWLFANFLIPLLRNSLERVYKKQIDSFLTKSIHYLKVILWRIIQLILILPLAPTLLSKIPNFMHLKAQNEYEPIADVLLDKNFPQKMLKSWKMVLGNFFGICLIMVFFFIMSKFSK